MKAIGCIMGLAVFGFFAISLFVSGGDVVFSLIAAIVIVGAIWGAGLAGQRHVP